MSENQEDLWGDLAEQFETSRHPFITLMQEQAKLLSEKTDGLVYAHVRGCHLVAEAVDLGFTVDLMGVTFLKGDPHQPALYVGDTVIPLEGDHKAVLRQALQHPYVVGAICDIWEAARLRRGSHYPEEEVEDW